MDRVTQHPAQRLVPDGRGGWCGGIIDLSVPAEDPEVSITELAPGLAAVRGPRRPVRIGHAIDVHDPDGVIYTDGKVIPPGEAGFVNGECADCDSALVVLPNQEPGITWLVIEHSSTCPALARWTRRAS